LSTTPLTAIPGTLVAGDTWDFLLSFADYPASEGWAASLYLRGAGTLTVAGVAEGDAFRVTVPASGDASSDVAAGSYVWAVRVENAGVAQTPESGTVVVKANPATAAAGDLQSEAERMLPVVRAELRARITGNGSGYSELQVHNRALKLFTLEELRRYEKELAAELARQRGRPAGGPGYAVTFRGVR
jgi:hypothetical protein